MDERVAEEMKGVRKAYGKVAMKRLIDMVPGDRGYRFSVTPQGSFQKLYMGLSLYGNRRAACYHERQPHHSPRSPHEYKVQIDESEKGLALFDSVLIGGGLGSLDRNPSEEALKFSSAVYFHLRACEVLLRTDNTGMKISFIFRVWGDTLTSRF
jgi:hypothetical protein